MPVGRRTVRQRSIRVRACNAIGVERVTALERAERGCGCRVEPAVDRALRNSVPTQLELEHGNVPTDRAHRELALPEKRPTADAERASCRTTDPTRRPHAVPALECHECGRRQRPADVVDRPGVESVSTESDLERGDACIGREPGGSERENANDTATPTTAKRRMRTPSRFER